MLISFALWWLPSYMYICTHMNIYIHIHMYVYICVCMCICVYRVQAKTINSKRFRRLLLLEYHQKAKISIFRNEVEQPPQDFLFFYCFLSTRPQSNTTAGHLPTCWPKSKRKAGNRSVAARLQTRQ